VRISRCREKIRRGRKCGPRWTVIIAHIMPLQTRFQNNFANVMGKRAGGRRRCRATMGVEKHALFGSHRRRFGITGRGSPCELSAAQDITIIRIIIYDDDECHLPVERRRRRRLNNIIYNFNNALLTYPECCVDTNAGTHIIRDETLYKRPRRCEKQCKQYRCQNADVDAYTAQ